MSERVAVAGKGRVPRREPAVLSATEEFIAQCSTAVKADRGPGATQELLELVVRDEWLLEELRLEANVTVLHGAEDLTILHVVMAERPEGREPDWAGEPFDFFRVIAS